MSITDELREYTDKQVKWMDVSKVHYRKLLAIADRIDAEHEKSMSRAGQLLDDAERDRDYNYANWQDCKQKVLQGNITFGELNARIKSLEDEQLSHCIELPKDADGVPIHVGDKLIDEDNKLQKPAIVKCILYNDEGCVVSNIDPRGCWYDPSLLRHHHAPTVEDVLTEMLYKAHIYDEREMELLPDLIADYAKRLTLAEGEDA